MRVFDGKRENTKYIFRAKPIIQVEENIGDANLMVYFVSKTGGPKWCKNFVGVANIGAVCSEKRNLAHSMNWFPSNYGLADNAWVSISQ